MIGIDEVGRGSLAGPVVVAAVAAPTGIRRQVSGVRKPLRDSKKLSPKRREEWFRFIQKHPHITYAIARVYPRTIERINISRAANLAALRAFKRLTNRYQVSGIKCQVYLDGGLYLGNGNQPPYAKTVVRGDEKFNSIKLASIVAKVSRDWFMTRLAKKYPSYGFEIHKGYGTKAHFAAIRKYGPSEAHRLSFLKNLKFA